MFENSDPPAATEDSRGDGPGAVGGALGDGNGEQLRKFSSPEIVFGAGAFALLGRYAAQFRARRALLVTDMGVRQAGWAGRAEAQLRAAGVPWTVFEGEHFQPQDKDIMAGADEYLRKRCSLVIALGGGSVMDCAKGLCAVVGNDSHILALAGGRRPVLPGPPLICAPTTPGSGAEASQFVVLEDSRLQRKVIAVGRALAPGLTLVDPDACASLAPAAFYASAMDALCHAIEAYVSSAHSPLSDLHALQAVRTLGALLADPTPAAPGAAQRAAASLGGLHAGLAFSNAGLGLAHALAHALESLTALPHVMCLAWALPAAVRYNYPAAAQRYEDIARALGGAPVGGAPADDIPAGDIPAMGEALAQRLETRMHKTGLDPRQVYAALPSGWAAQAAQLATSDVFMATNPVLPAPGELERWLEHAAS